MSAGRVHVVMPGDVHDVAAVSGGNAYDRRACRDLPAAGWAVHEIAVPGAWPRPDTPARAALAAALAGLPDGAVVLADGLVACGVPDVVVPETRRLRLALLVHLPLGDETRASTTAATELAALERETLHAASAVVATSPWAARRLADRHGLTAGRVHVATPGVDPAPPARGSGGAGGLLCVGSITPTKGQDLLVEALATVTDQPWHCDLVGPLHRDPAHVTAVRDAVQRHRLGTRVRLTGPRTGEPLAAAYATADLLVLPSRAESYGMVLTEALARGIPVLATAVGGVPETLGLDPAGPVPASARGAPGVAAPAILVAPDDASALAAGLRRWFTDPALRDALRRAALARRDTLDGWEVTARCLAAVLARLRGTPG